MKRIAFLSHGGFGTIAGREQLPALSTLIERLSEWNDITIFVPTSMTTRSGTISHGSACVVPVQARADTFYPFLFRAFRTMIIRLHRRHRFDILQGIWAYPGGSTAVALSRTLNIPCVVSIMGGEAASLPEISYGLMQHPILRRVTLWTCRNATALVASTQYQINELRNFGLRRNDIPVIPSGVPRESIPSLTPRKLSPPYHILHVANLTEVKDQKTLVRTFRRIAENTEARLRIIGPDYMKGEIQRFVGECNLQELVEFTGYLPHSELTRHYQWADILLHTSLYEGQAMVVVEAASQGAVVCGTRVGLIADLGDNLTVSSEPGNPDELASKVLALLKNPSEFAKLQRNAHRWTMEHPIEWTARSYQVLYNLLLEAKQTKNNEQH